MTNPENKKTKKDLELESYQALLVPVAGELALLIDTFELLKPTLEEYIKKRFIQNPYLRGSALADGDAFGKIEGMIEGDYWNGWRVAGLSMVNSDYISHPGGL
jgi:hypothetical protein